MSTTTNLGPLTTPFTPPTACSLLDISFERTTDNGARRLNGKLGQSCSAIGTAQLFRVAEPCFPGSFGSYINSYTPFPYTIAVYSPGTLCPSGSAPSCTVVKGAGAPAPVSPSAVASAALLALWRGMRDGETAVRCCPSGYVCAQDDAYNCISYSTAGEVVTGVSRGDGCSAATTTVTIQSGFESDVATARGIVMVRADSVAATGVSSSTGGAAQTSGRTGESSGVPTSSGNTPDMGLPLGAKIGIGVGVPLFVILAAVGLVVLLLLRKRKRKAKAQQAGAPVVPYAHKPELEGSGGYAGAGGHAAAYTKAELGTGHSSYADPHAAGHMYPGPAEMDHTTSQMRPSELHANQVLPELGLHDGEQTATEMPTHQTSHLFPQEHATRASSIAYDGHGGRHNQPWAGSDVSDARPW